MPKATVSPAGRIVNYFRSAKLEDVTLVFDIVRDVMRERKQKSSEARARATTPSAPAAVPDKPKSKTRGKRKRTKKVAAPAASPALPLDSMYETVDPTDAGPPAP